MRGYLAQLVWSDSIMNGHGITQESQFAGDVDTPGPRPYIVYRWGGALPGVDVSRVRTLTVWFHDHPNDYTRIDAMVRRVRSLFEATYAVQTETGWITDIRWTTDSDDLTDDGTRTICRTSTYTIVGSGI